MSHALQATGPQRQLVSLTLKSTKYTMVTHNPACHGNRLHISAAHTRDWPRGCLEPPEDYLHPLLAVTWLSVVARRQPATEKQNSD